MEGDADTTAIAVSTTLRYIAKHPLVQEKARVELDRVCSVDRMPTWHDFNVLPYINCIMKEGQRMNPV